MTSSIFNKTSCLWSTTAMANDETTTDACADADPTLRLAKSQTFASIFDLKWSVNIWNKRNHKDFVNRFLKSNVQEALLHWWPKRSPIMLVHQTGKRRFLITCMKFMTQIGSLIYESCNKTLHSSNRELKQRTFFHLMSSLNESNGSITANVSN